MQKPPGERQPASARTIAHLDEEYTKFVAAGSIRNLGKDVSYNVVEKRLTDIELDQVLAHNLNL